MAMQAQECCCEISTHAPAGGATVHAAPAQRNPGNFYSRPCGRGDQSELVGQREAIISTHAPAGGATSVRRNLSSAR